MNLKKRLLSLMLSALVVLAVSAAVPFKTTRIVDGKFAFGTTWYTMQIGSAQNVISDNGTADRIVLGKGTVDLSDAQLWCFVGDETNGFRIYNKQAGATKVLASSTEMKALSGYGGTGGATYPTLQAQNALPEGYVDTWDLSASDKLADQDGYFLILHGTDCAVNNFGGNGDLAFWAEGKDAGSTITFAFAETTLEIKEANGQFTSSNSNKTWHAVWSSNDLAGFTLGTGQNNMTTENGSIAAYSGTSGSCTHTLTAPQNCVVAAYSFDFKNTGGDGSYSLNLNVNNKAYKTSATTQHVEVSGLSERMATYNQSGANKGITLSNYYVTIRRSIVEGEAQFEVFPTPSTGAIPYRIPAIAKAYNGDLIAVADYRHSRADIGMATNGRIDIHARISKDNGKTWGDIFSIINGQGGNAAATNPMYVAFGDPCIIADSESPRVMVFTCSGNVSFPNGTRDNHQGIARFYSEDNGKTWGEPVDISEAIYKQFDAREGGIRCMFVGSGKISQSKIIKVGEYYRIYCAPLVKLGDGSNVNFVLYSDDFGETWDVLGGVHNSPIPTGGDEPKADELPDGSVLISSRTSGGRIYNIYTYTNAAKGEGSWGNASWSNNDNKGVIAKDNSTNGEIMFVPVQRNADGEKMYLLLQSVPFGSGRANVGIYYKELASLADFMSPENLAKNWDGRRQSSSLPSAYSTMCWQADNTVAFLYEEDTYGTSGGGYTIVYKNYSIEEITDSAYTYNADIDANTFVAAGIDELMEGLVDGNFVGAIDKNDERLTTAFDNYKAQPTFDAYQTLHATINELIVNVEPGCWYRLRNVIRKDGTLYLNPVDTRFTVANNNKIQNANQLFTFKPVNDTLTRATSETDYYLYSGNYQLYLGPLGNNETEPAVSTTTDGAGTWKIVPAKDGRCQVVCTNKTGSNSGLHLSNDNSRLVPWLSNADASLWYVEKVETYPVKIPKAGWLAVNLPFAVDMPEGVKAYTVINEEVIDSVDCLIIDEINGSVSGGLLLTAEAGNYELPIAEAATAVSSLSGTLRQANVSGSIYQLNSNGTMKKRTSSSGTISANKAYYESNSGVAAFTLMKKSELPVDIEGVEAVKQPVKFYNLNGQLVKNPTRGIYVTSDGKKVFVK